MTTTRTSDDTALLTCTIGEDDIIYLTMRGNISDNDLERFNDWANEVRGAMVSVSTNTNGKVLTLIDVSQVTGFGTKVVASLHTLMTFNRRYATRTAVFGAAPLIGAITYSAIILTRRFLTMKLFSSKEPAMEWLLSEASAPSHYTQ